MGKLSHLTGFTQEELVKFVQELDEPAYRGRQIFAALHNRRLRYFAEMSDLPRQLRVRLGELATGTALTVESRYISADGTRRYLKTKKEKLGHVLSSV